MGASSNFDNTSSPSSSSQTDDVSFSRPNTNTDTGSSSGSNMGSQSGTQQSGAAMNTARNALDTGVEKAQDVVDQLQQKASDMTSRLVNNIDVEDLTQKLEMQVREHPARTLLLAVGVGYLLGKSMK